MGDLIRRRRQCHVGTEAGGGAAEAEACAGVQWADHEDPVEGSFHGEVCPEPAKQEAWCVGA